MAVGRVTAAVRLWARRVSPPVRSERQLGIAAVGAGRGAAGSDPAAGARRQAAGPGSPEVSGAGGAAKSGRLPANGRDLRRASLRYAGSGPDVHGVAQEFAGPAETHSGCSRAVLQNTAPSPGKSSNRGRGRPDPRSGDGGGDRQPGTTASGGSHGDRSGWSATRGGATSARAHSTATQPHRRRTSTGETTAC
jgi:hypothetical protein